MLFLQASWNIQGRLVIWAEDSALHSSLVKNDADCLFSASTTDHPNPKNHPFVCSSDRIAEVIDKLGTSIDTKEDSLLFLPTANNLPLPADKLAQLNEFDTTVFDNTVEASLCPWKIQSITLEPVSAVNLLTSLPPQLPAGIKLDDSFKFWREATKLLLELLSRGRFLPKLTHSSGKWTSQWSVFIADDEDKLRLQILAAAMPPVCRALVQDEGQEPAQPGSLIESFLAICSNSLIRSFIKSHQILNYHNQKPLSPKQLAVAQWINSLSEQESTLTGSDHDFYKLDQALRAWSGGLLSSAESCPIVCNFRLVPPPDNNSLFTPINDEESRSHWLLEFLFTSPNYPGAETTASQLWQGSLGFLRKTELRPDELEDRFLRDLARALPIFPPLRRALAEAHPAQIKLTIDEAFYLYKEARKGLEQIGVNVLLPDYWSKTEHHIGLRLKVHCPDLPPSDSITSNFLAARALLDYSWEIAIGSKTLSIEEFKKLLSKPSPLIEINGQWLELPLKKAEATLKFIEEEKGKISLLQALRTGVNAESRSDILPVVDFQTSGWLEQFVQSEKSALPLIDDPPSFRGSLRPYQKVGLAWLNLLSKCGVGACLADDMGLGKTIQLIALLLHEKKELSQQGNQISPKPTLLVVPMSILANWEQECSRFAPELKVKVHHGQQRLQGEAFLKQLNGVDLFITTYHILVRDEELFTSANWRRIVLDEAQNIKNIETKQTQSVRRISQTCLEKTASNEVFHRLALTGTPLENHLDELWSIFDFLVPGLLSTQADYRRRFALPIERFRSKESSGQLSKLIQPFILRRLKSDPKIIDDLPEKIEMPVFTTLCEEQASLYQNTLSQMLGQVDQATGIHRKGLVLATITKLKQICNHPALLLKDTDAIIRSRSGKVDRLEELLEEALAEGDKALIFTQFAQFGKLLRPYLQERFETETLFLHGAVPRGARDKMITKFRSPDGPSLFILSLKAGGFGLNLTEANQVFHIDQWWNPAVQEQATDRAYRIGQKRSVQVRKFITRGTLEEKIQMMLDHKRSLAQEIVGSTKNIILDLSTSELQKLLQLTPVQE